MGTSCITPAFDYWITLIILRAGLGTGRTVPQRHCNGLTSKPETKESAAECFLKASHGLEGNVLVNVKKNSEKLSNSNVTLSSLNIN